MERRAFLSLLAGSPLVFGLRELVPSGVEGLLAQDDAAPDFIKQALNRMKENRKYGVFIVIPSDPRSGEWIGEGLLDQLAHSQLGGRPPVRLFCTHVFVCLTEAQAGQAGLSMKVEGEGILRLLVNPEGKQVHSDRVKISLFKDKTGFSESFSEFIHGKDLDRLRGQAKSIQESMSEEVRQAADRLNNEDVWKTLPAVADKIAPWLTYKSYFAKEGGPYLTVLETHYVRQLEKGPLLALPFGIKAERVAGLDSCPPCGMGGPYKTYSFRFLSFYTK